MAMMPPTRPPSVMPAVTPSMTTNGETLTAWTVGVMNEPSICWMIICHTIISSTARDRLRRRR